MAQGLRGVKAGISVGVQRVARDIEAIAGFSECDTRTGWSRPTFSPAWRGARDYVMAQAAQAGCTVRVDAAGNVHARPARLPEGERAWLCGSHVDSVPTGGMFDGVAGVVAALEVLRAAPGAPVELIVFAEEEGTTFSLGMLGSRAWAGTLPVEKLRLLRNGAGQDYISAGAAHGVSAERLEAERLRPRDYRGLIETHVEQGPGMWKAGTRVAVVSAIAGRRQYACTFTGEANHAGATAMKDRRDALAGAAEAVAEPHHILRDVGEVEGVER
jgi:hydantoinase/carbamoylase family amidase